MLLFVYMQLLWSASHHFNIIERWTGNLLSDVCILYHRLRLGLHVFMLTVIWYHFEAHRRRAPGHSGAVSGGWLDRGGQGSLDSNMDFHVWLV